MTARAESKQKPKAGDRSRGRVLLITDEEQSQFIDAIAERGIDVVGVSNGAAALVSLQRSRPHLVVADIKARGLRMRELGKMLAQSDDGIPLVLVGSERSTLSARRAALQNGAFVRKLRQKIEPEPNSPRILLTELGVGYRLAGENDQNGFGEAARADSTSRAH
jgi:DNA-binding response OmpR family regulator